MTQNSQCTNYIIFKQSLQIGDYLVQLDDDISSSNQQWIPTQ